MSWMPPDIAEPPWEKKYKCTDCGFDKFLDDFSDIIEAELDEMVCNDCYDNDDYVICNECKEVVEKEEATKHITKPYYVCDDCNEPRSNCCGAEISDSGLCYECKEHV